MQATPSHGIILSDVAGAVLYIGAPVCASTGDGAGAGHAKTCTLCYMLHVYSNNVDTANRVRAFNARAHDHSSSSSHLQQTRYHYLHNTRCTSDQD
jgi:hypothetical protein